MFFFQLKWKLFEPRHDKTNKIAWAPSEDPDQPGHPPSLIRVFAFHMKKAWVLSYPLGECPGWSVFAGRTVSLLVLSRGGSFLLHAYFINSCILLTKQPTFYCIPDIKISGVYGEIRWRILTAQGLAVAKRITNSFWNIRTLLFSTPISA